MEATAWCTREARAVFKSHRVFATIETHALVRSYVRAECSRLSLDAQMCGIVGIYNYAATGRDEISVLTRMRDTLVHRGPDDGGVYRSEDRKVLLGHRRLSIVDLSSAGH